MDLNVTPGAANRISALVDADGRAAAHFRLSVEGGGCGGFQYAMSISDERLPDDHSFPAGSAEVRVDDMSGPFLNGSTLDWVSEIAGDRFEVKNPNARGSCGCGSSFSA